ncbi:MAG: hypothetical protein ACTTKK_08400 [Ottowia sp.]
MNIMAGAINKAAAIRCHHFAFNESAKPGLSAARFQQLFLMA